ncbi:MAG: hypothetical protein IJT79_06215 [Ruminococcus sp.]|nr:hypothetical protein [Ruminococcus sp.]
MKKKIVFVGGDKRQVYAARKLLQKGYMVYLAGFDKLKSEIPVMENFYEADVVVLPVTGLKDGAVPAYYSDNELKLEIGKLKGKLVFMGKAQTLNVPEAVIYDLLKSEYFSDANALPTAEGAVLVALQNYEGTINGSRCLVVGYGRIGKVLSKTFRALGANVSVATRSKKKAESIKSDGNMPIDTNKLGSLCGYDIVFNTADALVLDSEILRNSYSSTLIIDLASMPGGVDFKTAESMDFKVVHALALPGKYSPKAAGEIISDTILKVLKEE